MHLENQVLILESFKITDEKIIAIIQHYKNGLPKGTRLLSKDNFIWEVAQRVISNIGSTEHILFPDEEIVTAFFQIRNSEVDGQAGIRQKIVERERNNIFEYIVKPIGHNTKPATNEILELIAIV